MTGSGIKKRIFCIRRLFLGVFIFLFVSDVFAKISFNGLDISSDSRLLFRADSSSNGSPNQNALFLSSLTDLRLQQITAFPEKIDLLENGKVLQVRNVFGCARIPVSGGLPSIIAGFSSFVGSAQISIGRTEETAVSEDGRWIIRVEPVTSAYGNLVLLNVSSSEKTVIASHVERPDRRFPAVWSPDSQIFIYTRGGNLYYYPVGITLPLDESYRLIGEGEITSVAWGKFGDFFYLSGQNVYRVRGSEVFFRSIYRDFIEVGASAGTLPFSFDPHFDEFYLDPDSRALLICKGDRALFFYPLGYNEETALPYIRLPESCFKINVLCSPNKITVIAQVRGKDAPLAFRLNIGGAFSSITSPEGENAVLSPDGTNALFWGKNGVTLYDYIHWKIIQTVSDIPTFSCIWLGNDDFITGNADRIERIHIERGEISHSLICLSSADSFAFEGNSAATKGARVLAKNQGVWFVTDGKLPWMEIHNPAVRSSSLVSGRYRIYLEKQGRGPYENLPMIRNITAVGTMPLLTVSAPPDEMSDGSRSDMREIALCFDLYNDDTGLNTVLTALDRFNIKATFFINGEFIRQHPHAVREIADSGHEAASMFFAPIDLATSRYQIDGDFIARGLARNEDEFFRSTGEELKLFWHPPFYVASSEIIDAAAKAGYKTIRRDVDPMDSLSRDELVRMGIPQYTSSDMADLIINKKKPGSIIPIRLGLIHGGRSDYLFNRINVILDALVSAGYSVVPVSTIREK